MPIVTDDTALLSGNSWNGIDTGPAPIIVTFSFPTSLAAYDDTIGGFTATTVSSYAAFTTAEQAQALTALGEWAAASGIVFVQVAPGQGDINFGNVAFSTTTTDSSNGNYQNAGGIGFYPYGLRDNFAPSYFQDDLTTAGDIFMNTADQSSADGTVSLPTLVHEIGHAIGLKHPTQTVTDPLGVVHDQVLSSDDPNLTIMASSGDSGGTTAAALKPLDDDAAMALYGPTSPTGGVITTAAAGANSLVTWSWDPVTQTLTQTAATTAAETIHGTSVNDIIIGNDAGDTLFGLGGNDSIVGGAGNDTIFSGSGNDTLVGGGGNDTFYVRSTSDTIIQQPGGSGSVYASASYTAPANVNFLQVYGPGLTATANNQGDTLFGDGTFATHLIGGTGNDTISGGAGNDTIAGGGGVDELFGGGGANTFVFTKVSDAAATGSLGTYIGDFQSGIDKIDLSAIPTAGGGPLTFSTAGSFSGQPGQVIDVPYGSTASLLEIDTNGDGAADFSLGVFGAASVQASDLILEPACYAAGTRIATDRGNLPIETLQLGDLVRTMSGALRPVRWIGHRRIDTTRHPDPARVWPFLVEAGAFGDGIPSRDLWLSPGHHVVVGDALIGICRLGNGRTIRQMRLPSVEYWHVELDTHDILLAEGLGAESYLDTGNRCAFVNGGAYLEAHPDFSPVNSAFTCLELVEDGHRLHAAKAALLARVFVCGETLTEDEDLHGLADGKRIEPVALQSRRRAIVFPPDATTVILRSRVFVPQEITPASIDDRRLGFCAVRLHLDGDEVPLDDTAILAQGWHALETNPDGSRQRWSSGEVRLPAGTRLAMIDLGGSGRYWRQRQGNLVAVAG